MYSLLLSAFQTFNQLLTAGIAISAFSLLLYALAFNLRDRVARSFAIILVCVVIVFVGDAIASVAPPGRDQEFWLRIQWVGIVFLPPSYLQFSVALLATTGRPARGIWRWMRGGAYLISVGFLAAIPLGWLVGPLLPDADPAPHLQRTTLTLVFTAYYAIGMILAWRNFILAYRRTVTNTGQRRMRYLLAGSLAPALGAYPYLLFGYDFALQHMVIFWLAATLSNLVVTVLLVVMAYSVAFFGVPWPDRVVRRRLAKWLMRGPLAASTVLAITTLVRRAGEAFGLPYSAFVPVVMVGSLLIIQDLITLTAPWWERHILYGNEHKNVHLLQSLQERLLTSTDVKQFLEGVLAAVCDRMQVTRAFVATLGGNGLEMLVTMSGDTLDEDLSTGMLETVIQNGSGRRLFSWGSYWLAPLYDSEEEDKLLGLLAVARVPQRNLDDEQSEALLMLSDRAAMALRDRHLQQQVFTSLEALTPQIDRIQRLRAASRYDGASLLAPYDASVENGAMVKWVKDALTHYWGGPKLTESPLMQLKIVRKAANEREENLANALRAILKDAIEQVRPEGERRFTAEWILYNILDMKFMEGYKVREIALRLAMSEADLYRKQRVAIEAVADAILDMEQRAHQQEGEMMEDVVMSNRQNQVL